MGNRASVTVGPTADRDQRSNPSGFGERGVTPAVSKSLEVGLVVLFVALLTTVLLGGVVPDYRRAVDARVGDRALVTASDGVEAAVRHAPGDITVRHRVDLPTQIGGSGYAVRVDGRSLVLDHPDPAVTGRVRLVLPPSVDSVSGRWESGDETVVRVRGDAAGLTVKLSDGGGG